MNELALVRDAYLEPGNNASVTNESKQWTEGETERGLRALPVTRFIGDYFK